MSAAAGIFFVYQEMSIISWQTKALRANDAHSHEKINMHFLIFKIIQKEGKRVWELESQSIRF